MGHASQTVLAKAISQGVTFGITGLKPEHANVKLPWCKICALTRATKGAHSKKLKGRGRELAGMKRAFDVAISLACFVASVFFAWAAWLSVERAAWTPQGDFRLETSGSAWNPPYPGILKVFLFVILVLLAIQFAIFTINHLRRKGQH